MESVDPRGHSRSSRTPGLLIGLAVGVVVLIGVFVWMGWIDTAVRTGAKDFDQRMQQRSAYLQQLCVDPPQTANAPGLCECVMAAERPARDCDAGYHLWAAQLQHERCHDMELRSRASEYCTCVESVIESVSEAHSSEDRKQRARRHEACEALETVLPLPDPTRAD